MSDDEMIRVYMTAAGMIMEDLSPKVILGPYGSELYGELRSAAQTLAMILTLLRQSSGSRRLTLRKLHYWRWFAAGSYPRMVRIADDGGAWDSHITMHSEALVDLVRNVLARAPEWVRTDLADVIR